ncbi:MAG: type II CAAX endopeptidase family protein [Brumimicrobium sp.]|nr:type II CAAX endopeptidase family protein [Brumimicrobium sp.]
MKERFLKYPPFLQVVLLLMIGFVTFSICSMLASLVLEGFYPDLSVQTALSEAARFPVQYMFLFYLPFQLGFLLTPGLTYLWLTRDNEKKVFPEKSTSGVIYAFLFFIAIFLLLPLLNEINIYLVDSLGMFEQLEAEKIRMDQQMIMLFGKNASVEAYIFAVIVIGLITGISEELAFRRFLFHHLFKNTGKLWLSVVASAFVFALLHFNYLQFIPLFCFGVILAIMYQLSGSIWPAVLAHTLNNMLNIYWLRNENFPYWMENIELKTTIPSTVLLMGLLYLKYLRK